MAAIEDCVELRVHGVSGTPPTDLLARALVVRVAGDGVAGFYRPALAEQATDDAPALTAVTERPGTKARPYRGARSAAPAVTGPDLEGYVWGGLTSGAPSRAFWLLLLPFTLVNVAPRLRRPGPVDAAWVRALWAVTRLLALTLTVLLVLSVAGVSLDLVAWQCGYVPAGCAGASPGWLVRPVLGLDPGHRLAAGMLVPMAVVAAFWWISGRTIRANEKPTVEFAPGVHDPDTVEVGLDSTWMWDNEQQVRRLRHVHLQAGIAVVLATVGFSLHGQWWVLGPAAAVAAAAVVGLLLPGFVRRTSSRGWSAWNVVVWVVLAVTTTAVLGVLVFDRGVVDTAGGSAGLPGYSALVLGVVFAMVGLGVVLCAVLAWGTAAARGVPRGDEAIGGGPAPGLAGWGPAVLAALGVFLAAVSSAGLYVVAAEWLVTGSLKPKRSDVLALFDGGTLRVPEVIRDASLAYFGAATVFTVVVLVVAVLAAVSLLTVRAGRFPVVRGAFADDYPVPVGVRTPERDRQVLRVLWAGRVVDLAAPLLAALALVGGVLMVGAVVLLAGARLGWAAAGSWSQMLAYGTSVGLGPLPGQRTAQGLGAYLVVYTLVAVVALGALAFRVRATRRSLGILWDLASFWPRAAHPLAAPCYAERTVPDLVGRIDWFRHEGGRRVVLAGHSQGTVISAATLFQLSRQQPAPHRVPSDVGYLSFGCVLRRLYARYFPAYFGPPVLADLAVRLGAAVTPAVAGAETVAAPTALRWRNLWRYSDYLGGPVESGPPPRATPSPVRAPDVTGVLTVVDGPDLHLVDPAYAEEPGDTVWPAAGRHSTFWDVREFQVTVVDLCAQLTGPLVGATSNGVAPTNGHRSGESGGSTRFSRESGSTPTSSASSGTRTGVSRLRVSPRKNGL